MSTFFLKKTLSFFLIVTVLSSSGFSHSVTETNPTLKTQIVNYGQIEFGLKQAYQKELLEQLLDATIHDYGPYQLNFVTNTKNWSTKRYLQTLSKGELINLSWGAVNWEKPEDYNMVRINYPILKNSNGYRILLIHKSNQKYFNDARSFLEFKKLKAAQVKGWADVDILEHNGIEVEKPTLIHNIYPMLKAKRFDYFPLGLLEITEIHSSVSQKFDELTIENSKLIYYPSPIYFQANKRFPKLILRITDGMKIMNESGMLDKLFDKHFGSEIKKFNLKNRTIIELTNPYLPKSYLKPKQNLINRYND